MNPANRTWPACRPTVHPAALAGRPLRHMSARLPDAAVGRVHHVLVAPAPVVDQVEPFGRWPHPQRLMRTLGVVLDHPGVHGGLQLPDGRVRRSAAVKHSARIVLCSRSTFPVVVGDRGAVSRCLIPFSAQIRSNNTSLAEPGGRTGR